MILTALAIVAATPSTIHSALWEAKPGDTIKLTAGDYGTVTIKDRNWPKRITLNASGAKLRLVIQNSSGIYVNGGTFGPNMDGAGYAAQVQLSKDVTFYKSAFVNSKRGLVIDRSQRVKVSYARFSEMTIDGVNIALSQQVTVLNIVCEKFDTGEAHPDCVQGWSRPGGITSDVLVEKVTLNGPKVQGIFFGNHVRNGVNDGGYDRIVIRNNSITGSYPQGIGLYECRNCEVTGNRVSTLPGSKHRVSINIVGGSVKAENNSVGPKP